MVKIQLQRTRVLRLHYLTPCPANDITISCKGCSHYPSSSTNRRNISACLFQPTRNTDLIQTANSSSYCRYGNNILLSLLPWGASFNSITELGETASQRLYPCNSVLRPTLSSFSVKIRRGHCCGHKMQYVILYKTRSKSNGLLHYNPTTGCPQSSHCFSPCSKVRCSVRFITTTVTNKTSRKYINVNTRIKSRHPATGLQRVEMETAVQLLYSSKQCSQCSINYSEKSLSVKVLW
jgi:hypothetical protein